MLVAGVVQTLPLLQLVMVWLVMFLLLLVLQPVLCWKWLLQKVLLMLCLISATGHALYSAAALAPLPQPPGFRSPAVPAVNAGLQAWQALAHQLSAVGCLLEAACKPQVSAAASAEQLRSHLSPAGSASV
jgi:formate-dependent nitrite reductase membrane component NrfD